MYLRVYIYIYEKKNRDKKKTKKNQLMSPVFDQNEKETMILTENFMKKEADSICR